MPVKTSLVILICKLVFFCTMLYNIVSSLLSTKWDDLEDDPSPLSLPWLSRDQHNGGSPIAVDVVNVSSNDTITDVTIYRCINTTTEPVFPICIYPVDMDKYISKALLSEGIWEPYITPLIQKALRHYKDAFLIDVGANIGYYSLLAASMGHPVVAIEPSIVSVQHFRKAIQLGEPHAPITVLHNAILDRRRRVTLTRNADNQGGLWVVPLEAGHNHVITSNESIINTLLMDDLQTMLSSARQVIIKVDIEGFECQAVTGGYKLLKSYHVPYIFMEWGKMFRMRHMTKSPCPQKVIGHMTDLLSGMDYTAVEVRTGFVLDPERSTTKWRIGDVYWKHRTAPDLQPHY